MTDASRQRTRRLALACAMRAFAAAIEQPVEADAWARYVRRLNDFQLGYLAGHERGMRRALRAAGLALLKPPGKLRA